MAEPAALPPLPQTRCPRCGGAFHCGANDPGPCACTTLRLDDAVLMQLSTQYLGCLCLRCLAELGGAPRPAGGAIASS